MTSGTGHGLEHFFGALLFLIFLHFRFYNFVFFSFFVAAMARMCGRLNLYLSCTSKNGNAEGRLDRVDSDMAALRPG